MSVSQPIQASPLDARIAVTFFDSHKADKKTEEVCSFHTLAQKIKFVTKGSKAQLPWLKLARFGDLRTDNNSLRHDANVLAITGLEADYDGGAMPVDDAVERLTRAGIASMVYTSPSHTEDSHRWRILCPLSREMPGDKRAHYTGRLNGLFNGILATESFTLSQSYYYGSVNHNPSHRVELIDGSPIDDHDELDEIWIGRPHTTTNPGRPTSSGPVNMTELLTDIMTGTGYHLATVRIAGVLARNSVPFMEARQKLVDAMEAVPAAQRDDRWHSRFNDIDRTVLDIYGKEARKRDLVDDPEPPEFDPEDPGYEPESVHTAPTRDDPPEVDHRQPKAKAPPKDDDGHVFELTWFDEIEESLDANDFVQGVLVEQGAVVIYGESNAGKTFWTTDLALHVAAGITWCGRRVDQGGVIYCVLEGGIGFRNRVSAWRRHQYLEGSKLPFAAISKSLNLLDPLADTKPLIRTIKAAAKRINMPVKLVVIDTLSRAMAGGNENAPDDMGALVKNVDEIRHETGACVAAVHHSGKDQAKGARGHSLLRAAIDTEIEVVALEGSDLKTATVVKQRELPKGSAFEFTLDVVDLGKNRHGESVTTCVVKVSGEGHAPSGAPAHRRLKGHNKRAFEVLADLVATSGQDGHPGAPPGAMSVPEKWWRERFYERAMAGAEPDAKKKAFRRAADMLIDLHVVGMATGRVWVARYQSPVSDEAGHLGGQNEV